MTSSMQHQYSNQKKPALGNNSVKFIGEETIFEEKSEDSLVENSNIVRLQESINKF